MKVQAGPLLQITAGVCYRRRPRRRAVAGAVCAASRAVQTHGQIDSQVAIRRKANYGVSGPFNSGASLRVMRLRCRHGEAQLNLPDRSMSDKHPVDPKAMVPSGPFTPRRFPSSEAVAGPVKSTFKMKLSQNNSLIGYFGVNSSHYAVLADSADSAVLFNLYPYGADKYYRNHASGWWLSISESSYAGFYDSWSASYPCIYNNNTRELICTDGGNALSFYSTTDGYLYFWDYYNVLQVDFEAAAPP